MICDHARVRTNLLLVALLLAGTAEVSSSAESHGSAAYTVYEDKISTTGPLNIDVVVYTPNHPLTQPPGAVVMFTALGQHASHPGIHHYAQTFATSGLKILILSPRAVVAPGMLASRFSSRLTEQQQQQQQRRQLSAAQKAIIPAAFDGRCTAAVTAYIQQLAKTGVIDSIRVAYWGVEWGAVAAAQAAAATPLAGIEVQTLLLQTPLLTATAKHTWQRLRAQGWQHMLLSLAVAAADWLLELLHVPSIVRPAGTPLAGTLGSGAFLQLQQHELDLHSMVAGRDAESDTAQLIPQSALLKLLFRGNPILKLLPKFSIPIAFYATAGDSDTSMQQYVAASKTAKFVSFHTSAGSRYSLLAGRQIDQQAVEEVIHDQNMLLIALLGGVELIKFDTAAGFASVAVGGGEHNSEASEQQQQQLWIEPERNTGTPPSVADLQSSALVGAGACAAS